MKAGGAGSGDRREKPRKKTDGRMDGWTAKRRRK